MEEEGGRRRKKGSVVIARASGEVINVLASPPFQKHLNIPMNSTFPGV
jgi:hypothetical protein